MNQLTMNNACEVCGRTDRHSEDQVCHELQVARKEWAILRQATPAALETLKQDQPQSHAQQLARIDGLAKRMTSLAIAAEQQHHNSSILATLDSIRELKNEVDAHRLLVLPKATPIDWKRYAKISQREQPGS